jgi:hypothetical protein
MIPESLISLTSSAAKPAFGPVLTAFTLGSMSGRNGSRRPLISYT